MVDGKGSWFMESGVNDDLKEDIETGEEPAKESAASESVEENASAEEVELDPIAALEAEVAHLKEESLRRAAELDNYRKRMAKELAESRKFSNQRLLMELLPVLDNFGMGMQMAEKEQGSMLHQGMSMVQGQLGEFFAGQGVTVISLEPGSDFDPNFHEAVSQEDSDEIEPGKILRVVRVGYLIGDRLLRPANVIVAKEKEETQEGEGE